MALFLIVFVATLIVIGVCIYKFPLAVVEGKSMEPTFHHGDILLCKRIINKRKHFYKEREIYVYKAPYDDNYFVIKRVSFVVHKASADNLFYPKHYMFMLGDNAADSRDSRQYGLVPYDRFIAKVLFRVKRRK